MGHTAFSAIKASPVSDPLTLDVSPILLHVTNLPPEVHFMQIKYN